MVTYKRIEEFKLDQETEGQINDLLNRTFGDYHAHRTYANQLPTFRFLAWESKQLIGHMAVEHRIINIGQTPAKIFGIADLCVSSDFQLKHIASTLLKKLETLGKKSQIDFLILIAQDHGVYKKNGFQLVQNPCRWLMINNNQTFGVSNRRLKDCLLIKSISDQKWEEGLLDFLGHIF